MIEMLKELAHLIEPLRITSFPTSEQDKIYYQLFGISEIIS